MKKITILLLFLNSCYMSYIPEDEAKVEDEATSDSYFVIEADSQTEVTVDSGIVDIEIEPVDIEKESETASTEAKPSNKSAKQELQEPILYDIVPKQGCINKDTEIYLVGMHIHWEASIRIKYQKDAEFTTFDQKLVDECNRSLIDWYDVIMISFRTRPDLILNDEYGFLSGEYKLIVVNPDSKESNEIGLSLKYCGNEVEEIEGC